MRFLSLFLTLATQHSVIEDAIASVNTDRSSRSCLTVDTSSSDVNCRQYVNRIGNGICWRQLGNYAVYSKQSDYTKKEERLYAMLNPLKVALNQFAALPNNEEGFQQFSSIVNLMALIRGVTIPLNQHRILWQIARNESRVCYDTIESLYCHQFYPRCHSINHVSKTYPICHNICIELKKKHCTGFLNMIRILNVGNFFAIPQCSYLPFAVPGSQSPCVMPNIAKDSNFTKEENQTENCDVTNMSRTESGYDCQEWTSQCPHKHLFTNRHYPELINARNRCRNPGGLFKRPWCFTVDQNVRWEYCSCKGHNVQSSAVLPTTKANVKSSTPNLVKLTTVSETTPPISISPSTQHPHVSLQSKKDKKMYSSLSLVSLPFADKDYQTQTSVGSTSTPVQQLYSSEHSDLQVSSSFEPFLAFSTTLVQNPATATSSVESNNYSKTQILVTSSIPSRRISTYSLPIMYSDKTVSQFAELVTPSASFSSTLTISVIQPTLNTSQQPITKPTHAPTTVYPPDIQSWIDYICPVYNTTVNKNAMCGSLLGMHRVRGTKAYLDSMQQSIVLFYNVMMPLIRSFLTTGKTININNVITKYLGKSSPNITREFKDLKLPTLASFDHCADIGLLYTCHYYNPFCKISKDGYYYYANPLELCQETCLISERKCEKELTFFRTFNRVKKQHPGMMQLNPYYILIPNCLLLPLKQPGTKQKCFIPKEFHESERKEGITETCYHGSGIMYRGNANKTVTSKDCLPWNMLDMTQWQENSPGEFNYLLESKNFCRNLQGMGTRPWCLTKTENNTITWEYCQIPHCPVDGQYGKWSSFSNCSSQCGAGVQMRTRHCDSPLSQFGGKPCQGVAVEKRICQLKPCPIHGGYSRWINMSPCNATCYTAGLQLKYRICNNPSPQYGGRNCSHLGENTKHVPCIVIDDCFEVASDVELELREKPPKGRSRTYILIIASGTGAAIFVLMVVIIAIILCKQKQILLWKAKENNKEVCKEDDAIEPYKEISLTNDNIAKIIKETNEDDNISSKFNLSTSPARPKHIHTILTKNGIAETTIIDN